MKRTLTIAACALISLACAQPASAQMMGGRAGSMTDQIQNEAKSQLAQRKKYTAPARRSGHMSSARQNYQFGGVDGTGRFDMSGRSPQGYFSVRDRSTPNLGRVPTSTRRAPRSNFYSKQAGRTTGRP